MPKKKIQEIVRKLKGTAPGSRAASARRPATKVKPIPIETTASAAKDRPDGYTGAPDADLSQFPSAFENKAGHYELIRVDGGQAYYSFTNRQEKTVDAAMPVITWRKMQERALAAFKETA
jgi:hypothetical protein